MIPPFSILNEYFHPLVFNRLTNHVLRCPFLQTRKSCASHMVPSASQKHLLVFYNLLRKLFDRTFASLSIFTDSQIMCFAHVSFCFAEAFAR